MVPCASSPVTRVLRLPLCETMRKTKLLRRRLDETLITLGSKCYYRWDLYYIWVQLLNLCLLHRSLQFELKWYLWCINTDLFFFSFPRFWPIYNKIMEGLNDSTTRRSRLQNSPYFCVFKYARAVKQKVFFFTDFEKKNRRFCSLINPYSVNWIINFLFSR